MMEDAKNVKLSKTILELKFMKRSKDRAKKEKEAAEGKAMYSSEFTEEMKKAGQIIFTETTIYNVKNLLEGRMSFGGMNPEIEKLMKNDKRVLEAELKKETDIDDVEMARNYSTVANTISNKFASKRNRNRNKVFKKPAVD